MLLPGGYNADAALRRLYSGLRSGEGALHGEGERLLAVLIWRNNTRKLYPHLSVLPLQILRSRSNLQLQALFVP